MILLYGDCIKSAGEFQLMERLPERFTVAVARAAAVISSAAPDLVLIAERTLDSGKEVSVVYSVELTNETLILDPPYSTEEYGAITAIDTSEMSVSGAAVTAAALALLGPSRVSLVVVRASRRSPDACTESVLALARRHLHSIERAMALREGGPHLKETGSMAEVLASRLRLTRTQRVQLLAASRSAAIVGGRVPGVLGEPWIHPSATKQENSRTLARILDSLKRVTREQ